MLCHIYYWTVVGVSEDRNSYIFRVHQSKKSGLLKILKIESAYSSETPVTCLSSRTTCILSLSFLTSVFVTSDSCPLPATHYNLSSLCLQTEGPQTPRPHHNTKKEESLLSLLLPSPFSGSIWTAVIFLVGWRFLARSGWWTTARGHRCFILVQWHLFFHQSFFFFRFS